MAKRRINKSGHPRSIVASIFTAPKYSCLIPPTVDRSLTEIGLVCFNILLAFMLTIGISWIKHIKGQISATLVTQAHKTYVFGIAYS